MDAAKKVVGPGLYLRGQVDYGVIEGVNYSTLKHLAKSALQYRHVLENGVAESALMFRGTAAHVATLEPHRFIKEFAVFEGERRAGKAWEAFKAENDGKKLIKQSEFDTAMRIRDAVRSHPVALRYLRKGVAEATLVWDDPETGVRCKGRPDFITDDHYVVDLKSTADVTPFNFARIVYSKLYHMQSAMYFDGYESVIKRSPAGSVTIAVEQKEPHDVVVFVMDDETLGIGRDTYRHLLGKLTECEKARVWPGYSRDCEVTLRLPKYAYPDESDLESLGLEFE